jgi:hypothetical protein
MLGAGAATQRRPVHGALTHVFHYSTAARKILLQ